MSGIELVQSSKSEAILIVDSYEYYKKRDKKVTTAQNCANSRHSAAETLQLQVASSYFQFEGTTTTRFLWEKLEPEQFLNRPKK